MSIIVLNRFSCQFKIIFISILSLVLYRNVSIALKKSPLGRIKFFFFADVYDWIELGFILVAVVVEFPGSFTLLVLKVEKERRPLALNGKISELSSKLVQYVVSHNQSKSTPLDCLSKVCNPRCSGWNLVSLTIPLVFDRETKKHRAVLVLSAGNVERDSPLRKALSSLL